MPQYFTRQWWSDSHADLFTHNVITVADLAGWTSAEAAAYAAWEPNNSRPTWPTFDEVTRWIEAINTYPGMGAAPTVNPEVVQLCLDVAVERIAMRTHYQVRPVDATGAVDPGGDPVPIPAGVKLATIMQAARWSRRPMSPDGVLGASEVAGVIRAQAMDPDIESMLAPWLALGLY